VLFEEYVGARGPASLTYATDVSPDVLGPGGPTLR